MNKNIKIILQLDDYVCLKNTLKELVKEWKNLKKLLQVLVYIRLIIIQKNLLLKLLDRESNILVKC